MYEWSPITDLDDRATSLGHRGITALAKVWQNHKQSVGDSPRDDGDAYLTALEQADAGELLHLVGLFVRIEERVFTQALAAVLPPAETLIDAAAELLRDATGASERDKKTLQELGHHVWSLMNQRLNRLIGHAQATLSAGFGLEGFAADHVPHVRVEIDNAIPSHLKPLSLWRQEVRLLCNQPKLELVCVAYAAGPLFRGVMAASVLYRDTDNKLALVTEPFVFTIDEQSKDVGTAGRTLA